MATHIWIGWVKLAVNVTKDPNQKAEVHEHAWFVAHVVESGPEYVAHPQLFSTQKELLDYKDSWKHSPGVVCSFYGLALTTDGLPALSFPSVDADKLNLVGKNGFDVQKAAGSAFDYLLSAYDYLCGLYNVS